MSDNYEQKKALAIAFIVKHFSVSHYVAGSVMAYAESNIEHDERGLSRTDVLLKATSDVVVALSYVALLNEEE